MSSVSSVSSPSFFASKEFKSELKLTADIFADFFDLRRSICNLRKLPTSTSFDFGEPETYDDLDFFLISENSIVEEIDNLIMNKKFEEAKEKIEDTMDLVWSFCPSLTL